MITMKVSIKKWGNSFAIRIPKTIAEDAHLENGSEVDISIANGRIVLNPIPTEKITLDSLIAGITEENKHHEIDTGLPIGKELL
jgi:antitoxin MazE